MTHTDVERARRQTENENFFREGGADVDELDLRCECGGHACTERLAVSVSDYLRVRKWDGRFFLAPGHEDRNSRTWWSATKGGSSFRNTSRFERCRRMRGGVQDVPGVKRADLAIAAN